MNSYWKPEQLARPSFAPRHWGGWLIVTVLWTLGHLPRVIGRALVSPLAPLMRGLLASRRRIAVRNLAACFPEKSEAEREQLLRGSFRALARMLAEMAWCWSGRPRDLDALVDVHGFEHLQAILDEGRGVLIVTAHVTCLELGARAIGERVEGQGIYRPLGNPVLEWYQNRGRSRYAAGMIDKRSLRSAIRYLRRGGVVWYAPDQDFGARESLFVPFFGVATATLLATHRLPAMTGCGVVTMMPRFDASAGRYLVEVSPVTAPFPTEDPAADLARVNALLESQVRKAPEQYWWVHRRFKTRPEGAPDFYGSDARPR